MMRRRMGDCAGQDQPRSAGIVSETGTAEAGAGFFLPRWRGLVPLDRLFWRDMVVLATGINLATSAAALAMLGAKLPLAAALAVHFAPMPYNLFLFLCVWRTAAAKPGPIASLAPVFAAVWLVLATLV
jgi:hypothetical protein